MLSGVTGIKSQKQKMETFPFFVNWKSQFDGELREHLHKAARNAKYTSPVVQDTIISLCENAYREKVLAMFSSSYWSLMADETEDVSNMEQVSVCARFVHNYEVYEELLGFVAVAKMDAQTIADALLSTLAFLKGYDGASVMSSSKNGVQAKIAKVFPNATYVIVVHMF